MNIKNSILIFLFTCLISSCATNYIVWNAHRKIKNVEIGMTKDQVIQIMGEKYMITSSSKDEQGNRIEVLGYKSDTYEEYKLKFINDKLIEWEREHTTPYITKENV